VWECRSRRSGLTSDRWTLARRVQATTSEDHTARVWDTETGLLVHALPPLHRRGVNTAAFSPNGRTLTTAADDMTARVWDLMGDVEEPGECLHTLGWDR
jgi:WD40 repeat protein